MDFISQVQSLSLTAQKEKEQILQELSRITPSIIQDKFVTPEVQQKIQELTKQLDSLKSANPHLSLTAKDLGQAINLNPSRYAKTDPNFVVIREDERLSG